MNRRIFSMVAFSTLFAAVVWVYGWLIYAALFTHPNAEDLSLSHPAFTVGRWTFIKHTLATYDGRYFINFMHTLTPLAFKLVKAYPLMAITGILFIITSFWWLLYSILHVSPLRALVTALVTVAVHFAVTPSLPHQLYWMSSSMVYLWCWSFFMLFAGSVFRLMQSQTAGAKAAYLAASCFSMAACLGCNEMMLPVVALFIAYVLITYRSHNLFQSLLFIAGLAAILTFFFIFSPGIGERLVQEGMLKPMQETHTVPVGLHYFDCYRYFFVNFICSPAIAGCVLLLLAGKFEFKKIVSEWVTTRVTVLFFSAAILTITLPYFVPLSANRFYPERIFGCVQLLVLTALVFLGIKLSKQCAFPIKLMPVACMFFAVWLAMGNTNVSAIITEFKNGSVSAFNKSMQQRHILLSEAAQKKLPYCSIAIPPLNSFPKSMYIATDIQPNRSSGHWNQAYEMFYGIDRISLSVDTANYVTTL
jgi:hypothetical protein